MKVAYFDGVQPQPQAAQLIVNQGKLRLLLNQGERELKLSELGICELAQVGQAWLYLSDGSSVRLHSDQGTEWQQLCKQLPELRPGWLTLLERHLSVLIIMTALLVGALLWYRQTGLAFLTEAIVKQIPESADRKLGDIVLKHLYDNGTLAESNRSDEFLADVRQELNAYNYPLPLNQLELRFAAMPGKLANAFALPNKTILITDGMLDRLAFHNHLTQQQRVIALAGIVAHEMGHIHYRHGTEGLVSFLLNSALGTFLFADVSEQLSLASLALMQTGYSRELEAQADDYALSWLNQQGLSSEYSAIFLEEMIAHQKAKQGKPPHWLRWLATHPEEGQRLAKWRQASVR